MSLGAEQSESEETVKVSKFENEFAVSQQPKRLRLSIVGKGGEWCKMNLEM